MKIKIRQFIHSKVQYVSWGVVIIGVSFSGSTFGLLQFSIFFQLIFRSKMWKFRTFPQFSMCRNLWRYLRMLKGIWYILYSEYSGYRVLGEWCGGASASRGARESRANCAFSLRSHSDTSSVFACIWISNTNHLHFSFLL